MSHGFGHSGGSNSSHGSSRGFGHSHLHGTQAKFDRNGDGRLSGLEWSSWYYNTYGMDIELAERRRVQQAKTDWSLWLMQTLPIIEFAYTSVIENTRTLIKEQNAEEQAKKAFLYWITYGIVNGTIWQSRCTTDAGQFVGNSIFYPYQALVERFLKNHPELVDYAELTHAVRNHETLYAETGILTEWSCGTFWKSVIQSLPPHHESALPPFSGSGVYTAYGDAESNVAVRCFRSIMEAIFPMYTFFSGIDDTAIDETNEWHQSLVEMHWKNDGKTEEDSGIDAADSDEEGDLCEDEDDDWDEPEYDEPAPVRRPFKKEISAPPPDLDDGTEYTFCTVRFPKIRRAYSYLCGDLKLSTGDFVRVPFGRYDAEMIGEVTAVTRCTASAAPYPPSRTKTVLGKADKPEDWEERMQEAEKAVKKSAEKPAVVPIERKEKPVAPAPKQSASQEKNDAASVKLQQMTAKDLPKEQQKPQNREITKTEPEPQSSAPEKKKRRLWPVFIAVIAVMAAAGVVLNMYLPRARERAAVYQEAIAYLNSENYDLAWQKLHSIETYRDAEVLAIYSQYAEIYADIPDLYRGGEKELGAIKLYFSREFQDDVDALAVRALQLKEEADKKAQEQNRLKQEQIQRDLEEKLRQIDEEARKKAAESAAEAKRQTEAQKQSGGTVYDGFHGQTFNYGGGSYDTGAGSGHSLREDYGDPEDLFEDGDYDDLDEAWDEWEEGW